MSKRKASDFTLMISTMLLVIIGIIMVFSSSWPKALHDPSIQDGYHFLRKQLIAGSIGFVGMIFFMNFPYWKLNKLAKVIFLSCIVLNLLIFTPLGIEIKGARRWIDLGFTTFMPSDAMKIGSIIYISYFLTKKKEKIKSFTQGVIPSLIIIAISCGTIAIQDDLSTSAVLGITLVLILFIAGLRFFYLAIFGALGGLGATAIILFGDEFRRGRILAFLDPFKYRQTAGWQVIQSLYALGSGGLFGSGLGKSRQKFFYIPEPHNDFIFAIIGEELGFIGCVTVIILFLLVIWRGIRIALNTDNLFGCFLASGIVALITVQSLIHIGVVTSSIPPTGIPLPFISYGGTSLMVYMSAVGILLNISRHTDLDRS